MSTISILFVNQALFVPFLLKRPARLAHPPRLAIVAVASTSNTLREADLPSLDTSPELKPSFGDQNVFKVVFWPSDSHVISPYGMS